MKTILLVVICTVVFIISMCFVENKRTENLNQINLEYQKALKDLNIDSSKIDDSKKSDNTSTDVKEEDEQIKITISGEVVAPGDYLLDSGCYLDDVIMMAGGVTSNADQYAYNRDYLITSSMEIYIAKDNNGNKISINTADEATLDMLPGIGTVLASRIIEYRGLIGQFNCIDELRNVEGLGSSIFNKVKDYIKL